eukprot:TRINITY_DN854_c0_g2_i1.p1 TRINITY_DN854_c0_g2~~TRINITY_DN854_c0_g2_i1.p1  ORF type:complete len:325 (-),score=85.90 TRINITY_DN854_c0_g2_i1:55-1029(-)
MQPPRVATALVAALASDAFAPWTAQATTVARSEVTAALRGSSSSSSSSRVAAIDSCGALASYPHAKPKNYEDSRKTRYDADLKKTVDVVFRPGDNITFKCEPGYSVDGSKDGGVEFNVECSDMGYYKPGGVCLKASKCGAIPAIQHALPTGRRSGDDVEMSCAEGYSLDGEKVVPGGLGKNQLFTLKCVEFSGKYEEFTGACKPSGHFTATESVRIYNKVFEALFIVSCKGTLRREFGAGNGPGVDDACLKIKDGNLQGDCQALATKIEADFESERAARKDFDAAQEEKDFPKDDPNRPGIAEEAQEFCTGLWKILQLQPPANF